jgi:hypothetical protein
MPVGLMIIILWDSKLMENVTIRSSSLIILYFNDEDGNYKIRTPINCAPDETFLGRSTKASKMKWFGRDIVYSGTINVKNACISRNFLAGKKFSEVGSGQQGLEW